jgi:asparagine synthase (glutamine-hydrolysing)
MKYYLNDDMLVKVDRASMANSLEVRVPFLDHNIVEYMPSVPKEMKYNGLTSKFILKKLAINYLPNSIVYRKKKGFGIPIGQWFNSFLKSELEDIIRNPNSFIHNFFSMSFTNKIMKNHFQQKYDNRKLLWTLFVIENWKNHEN